MRSSEVDSLAVGIEKLVEERCDVTALGVGVRVLTARYLQQLRRLSEFDGDAWSTAPGVTLSQLQQVQRILEQR